MNKQLIDLLSELKINTSNAPLDLFFSETKQVHTEKFSEEENTYKTYILKYNQEVFQVKLSHRPISKIIDDSKLLNEI